MRYPCISHPLHAARLQAADVSERGRCAVKVLFLYKYEYLEPIGIMALSAVLKQHGHQVEFWPLSGEHAADQRDVRGEQRAAEDQRHGLAHVGLVAEQRRDERRDPR